MKKVWVVVACLLLALMGCNESPKAPSIDPNPDHPSGLDSALEAVKTPLSHLEQAFEDRTSDIQVLVRGLVIRLLADDTVGDRHQRFILQLENDQTLLIAHNIDIAERVPAGALNQTIYVNGEYVWNDQGGLVHWTHIDPAGSHADGWIYYQGKKYQ